MLTCTSEFFKTWHAVTGKILLLHQQLREQMMALVPTEQN